MLKIGDKVITPTGRLATVVKFAPAGGKEAFDRIVCRYDGVVDRHKRLVSLQPHLLKRHD